MEQLFLRLLEEEEEVQDYVRAHYRLVMVDEFQDSNPIQLKIFNRLSELVATVDGHSYWVGDPKQAIYGFRGADTELVNSVAKYFKFYEDAEIHPEEGEHHLGSGRLTESWRSRAKLVELVNDMFTEPFKSDGIDERLIPLSPHFKNDTLPAIPLEHWVSKAGNETLRGEAIAFRVKQLLESHVEVHHGLQNEATDSIQPKDIAILCRANENCASLINALRKYGVPVSSSETDILPRIEVQFVISLLRFIQNPRSKSTIADLRRLLWSETPEAILKDRIQYLESLPEVDEEGNKPSDEWCQDWESVQTLLSRTAHYKELSIPDMVRALIYDTNLPALCAKWGDQDTRCQNLSTLQQLADDYDHMCLQMGLGTSINGFIDYLNTIQPDREQDNQSNTVKVFTYHGSKGLEWPVVILTELDKDSVFPSTLIKRGFMTVRECVLEDCATEQDPFAKKYFLHYFPYVVKPGKSSNPPDHLMALIMRVDIYQQLQNRTAAEERRLLYVGITRAKDCLYTFSKPNSNLKWLSNVGIENTNPSNPWGKPEYQPELVELYTPDDNDIPAAPTTYTMVQKPETHQERPARYLSPSKIGQYDGYNAHHTWSEHGAPITTQGWGNDYARIGTCIHDLFAVYRHGDDAFNRQAAQSVISGHGLSSQLSGHIEAILAAARWLHDTLQQKYPQLHPSGLQREHPFIQTLPNGQTLRGEMDLVWQYTATDGTPHAILVDYKTFPGVDLNAHTPQYYAQLSAYASALADEGIQVDAALIYYPVHGTIHKLVKSVSI
jgi:ATP-dependent exoDNAse (exonuclease V) beta subunit